MGGAAGGKGLESAAPVCGRRLPRAENAPHRDYDKRRASRRFGLRPGAAGKVRRGNFNHGPADAGPGGEFAGAGPGGQRNGQNGIWAAEFQPARRRDPAALRAGVL